MPWHIIYDVDFAAEIARMPPAVRIELFAHASMLEQYGPQLGRPWCDTLKGSEHSNMKELRFNADGGVWRLAFAFDPKRKAMLLVAGDKKGADQAKFYKTLIRTADARFSVHLEALKAVKKKEPGK
jgi:hypothetical protein